MVWRITNEEVCQTIILAEVTSPTLGSLSSAGIVVYAHGRNFYTSAHNFYTLIFSSQLLLAIFILKLATFTRIIR